MHHAQAGLGVEGGRLEQPGAQAACDLPRLVGEALRVDEVEVSRYLGERRPVRLRLGPLLARRATHGLHAELGRAPEGVGYPQHAFGAAYGRLARRRVPEGALDRAHAAARKLQQRADVRVELRLGVQRVRDARHARRGATEGPQTELSAVDAGLERGGARPCTVRLAEAAVHRAHLADGPAVYHPADVCHRGEEAGPHSVAEEELLPPRDLEHPLRLRSRRSHRFFAEHGAARLEAAQRVLHLRVQRGAGRKVRRARTADACACTAV